MNRFLARPAIFVLLLLSVITATPVHAQKWELTGLIGRRTTVAFDEDRIYQGGLDNLWLSTDQGETWSVVSPRYGDRFVDVVIHGRDALMVGETNHLLVSHDSAHRFSAASLSNANHLLPYKDGFLAAGYIGLSFSSDGGETWKLLTDSVASNPYAFCIATQGDTILCGTFDMGLLISTNGGVSWRKQLYVGPDYNTDIYGVEINNGLYYCATQSGTSYSSDGGKTWVRIDNGMPHPGSTTPSSRAIVAYGDTLIAGSAHNQIYRSLDRGASWSLFSEGLYEGAVAYGLKKHNGDLYAETTDGLYVIRHGTTVWKPLAGGRSATESIGPATRIDDMLYRYGTLYAATNNYGVCRSTDQGRTWTRGYYSIYYNGLLSDEAYGLGANDAGIVAMSTSPYRSTDSGKSWTAIRQLSGDVLLVRDTSIFIGYRGQIFRSFNNGKAWDTVKLPVPYDAHTYQLYDYGGGLFAANSASICRSTDNGKTWKRVNTGVKDSFAYTIAAKDGYFFAGTRDGLYRSTDLGLTWSRSSIGLPDSFVTRIFTNDTLLIASTKLGPYRSTDLGLTWTPANLGMEGYPVASFTTGGGYIYASTFFTPFHAYGAFVFRAPLVPKSGVDLTRESSLDIQCWPNPALDHLTIKLPEGLQDYCIVEVIDPQGMSVMSKSAGPGIYDVALDLRALPSGTYFIRVTERSGRTFTGRFDKV